MYIDLLLLTIVLVFITDISGFIPNLKSSISKILTGGRLKGADWSFHLLDCSLCQTFWTGLLYLIFTNSFSISALCYVCLLSFLTEVIKNILLLIKDALQKIINQIYIWIL